ncbi:MAG: ribosome biogenesis GTPase Der [Planctomycetota bacterium]|nr:MAG: ribosome biogenesis GTPase Der [Planctomycetota bacterium]
MDSKSLRPLVAIVGRPNVGKSTLFNRLVGERRAIVEPTAGVTRDRFILPVERLDWDLRFDLMDTGGIGIVDRQDLADSVEMQVMTGLEAAALVLFLVDCREGLCPLDEEVARMLRRAGAQVQFIANKAEGQEAERNLLEFSALGFGPPLAISAQEGKGLTEVWQALEQALPPASAVEEVQEALRIAVVGRRNTGKSSFVNALLGEQRVIVSDVPGTTRDAVDIRLQWQERPVVLVDTAGMHRRGKVANAVEYFSLTRSDHAIRRAHLTFLFLDLTDHPAKMDQELGRTIQDRYKPVVIVGTKADLVPDLNPKAFAETVEHFFPHLRGAPIVLLSNVTGKGKDRLMKLAFQLKEEGGQMVPTGELNRVVETVFQRLRFRGGRGGKPRVFYATQLRAHPPTFLLFVNRKELFEKEALRAISRELRKRLGFARIPVRIVLRERLRSPSKKG